MACPTVSLNEAEIGERLQSLPNWAFKDNALERLYDGLTYMDSVAVLNEITRLAEAENHHPDLLLSWKKLTIRYWTHTAKGVTALDFDLAHQTEELLGKHGK